MNSRDILYPLLGQVTLTLIVWLFLLKTRVGNIRRMRVNPQILANEEKARTVLRDDIHLSDNFENLFELPVLFYVAVLLIYLLQKTDVPYLVAAWGFVGFRAIHSWIHCTYNRIMHRFYMYLISSFILWGIWIRLSLSFWAP